jgi:hypothetical protein
MNKFLFLSFLFTAFSLCPKYLCKQSSQHFTKNTCVAYLEGDYYIGKCEKGNCSPALGNENSTCSGASEMRMLINYPGTKCKNSTDCFSNFCYKQVCKGQEKGQTCQSNYDCDPGLYCNSTYKCSELSQKSCANDFSCENNYGCNFNKCVPYFSIQPGKAVSNCPGSNKNILCDSATCGTLNGQSICIEALQNVVKSPYSCTAGSFCLSQTDARTGLQVINECICGLSKSGKAFCELLTGDKPSLNFFKSVKSWSKSEEIHKCNTMERFEKSCLSSWWNHDSYVQFLYYYLLYEYYPYVANAEPCVLSLYLPEFYKSYSDYASELESDSYSIIFSSPFFSAILLLSMT